MKIYEWILTLSCVVLIYTGIALWDKYPGWAVMAYIVTAVLFLSYLYFVKTLPILKMRKLFVKTAAANGFRTAPKTANSEVSKTLRQFPGFDDLFFSVEELQVFENSSAECFAGKYSLSGYGINNGYFLFLKLNENAGIEPLRLSRIIDKLDKFNEESERALATLPDELTSLLRTFPYDLHCIERDWLFDFDARNLDERNFPNTFDKVLKAFLLKE
jgi:hypothetical protein